MDMSRRIGQIVELVDVVEELATIPGSDREFACLYAFSKALAMLTDDQAEQLLGELKSEIGSET